MNNIRSTLYKSIEQQISGTGTQLKLFTISTGTQFNITTYLSFTANSTQYLLECNFANNNVTIKNSNFNIADAAIRINSNSTAYYFYCPNALSNVVVKHDIHLYNGSNLPIMGTSFSNDTNLTNIVTFDNVTYQNIFNAETTRFTGDTKFTNVKGNDNITIDVTGKVNAANVETTNLTVNGETTFNNNSKNIINGTTTFENGSTTTIKGTTTFNNGSTTTIKGTTTFDTDSNTTVKGTTTFNNESNTIVDGSTTFENGSNTSINGTTTVNGNTNIKGRTTFENGSTTTIKGTTTFDTDSNTTFNGTTTVTGNAEFKNGLVSNTTMTLNNMLIDERTSVNGKGGAILKFKEDNANTHDIKGIVTHMYEPLTSLLNGTTKCNSFIMSQRTIQSLFQFKDIDTGVNGGLFKITVYTTSGKTDYTSSSKFPTSGSNIVLFKATCTGSGKTSDSFKISLNPSTYELIYEYPIYTSNSTRNMSTTLAYTHTDGHYQYITTNVNISEEVKLDTYATVTKNGEESPLIAILTDAASESSEQMLVTASALSDMLANARLGNMSTISNITKDIDFNSGKKHLLIQSAISTTEPRHLETSGTPKIMSTYNNGIAYHTISTSNGIEATHTDTGITIKGLTATKSAYGVVKTGYTTNAAYRNYAVNINNEGQLYTTLSIAGADNKNYGVVYYSINNTADSGYVMINGKTFSANITTNATSKVKTVSINGATFSGRITTSSVEMNGGSLNFNYSNGTLTISLSPSI